MKVLVTGATGFIGSYVIEELLKYNLEVIATSSNEEKARSKAWFENVKYVPFDLVQYNPLNNYHLYFNEPDILIHLAWEGLPNYKSSFHIEENLPRHSAFLQNSIKHGLKNVNVMGTCLEYGKQEGELKEDMPSMPDNPYAIAKNELRKQIELFQKDYTFSFKWIRLFYMYGKGQNPKSLLSQLDKALQNGDKVFNMSSGEQTRDYLPVEEIAHHIVKIALQNHITGIINCCSGEPIKVKDFVERYLSNRGKTIKLNLGFYPYPDYEPMRFWGNTEKLHKAISLM